MIPFNKPYVTDEEISNIIKAKNLGHLSSDGRFTKLCSKYIETVINCKKAYITNSCTAALEAAALLINIKKGDEIIMPSFTFVSTATAFVLRGGVPNFVDIDPLTMNIDYKKIEKAITKKTKAIVAVHYAGIACQIKQIKKICKKYKIYLIEDAAHSFNSKFENKHLGTFGDIASFSFHETKNIISGEGGALIINNKNLIDKAEIILNKGTNRKKFLLNKVDKYSWVDVGSSFQPSEMIAAFLFAQLKNFKSILSKRKKVWDTYHEAFIELEKEKYLKRPNIPKNCVQSYHIYFLILKNEKIRNLFIKKMEDLGVSCVFHYIPLHSSKAGKKYTKFSDDMKYTNNLSKRLVRLPLWPNLKFKEISKIIKCTKKIIYEIH